MAGLVRSEVCALFLQLFPVVPLALALALDVDRSLHGSCSYLAACAACSGWGLAPVFLSVKGLLRTPGLVALRAIDL